MAAQKSDQFSSEDTLVGVGDTPLEPIPSSALVPSVFRFDDIIDRHKTFSMKWDMVDESFHEKDLLPLWIADMDFFSPPALEEAIMKRAGHGIFGYTALKPSYYQTVQAWFKRRHGIELLEEWIKFCPGVVPAICIIIQMCTQPGDEVIIQNPVYYPFINSIRNNGRTPSISALKYLEDESRYVMDFDDLELKAKTAKLMILCNPHNPVGRLWTPEELRKLGDILARNNVLLISDDIHCDIFFPENGKKYTSIATLDPRFEKITFTCTSISKTFNMAGFQVANILIRDQKLRDLWDQGWKRTGNWGPNAFAPVALEVAYTQCDEWFDAVLSYVHHNLVFLRKYLKEHLPSVKLVEPEATFLVWLDFRSYNLPHKKLEELMIHKAKIAIDEGYIFGEEGAGFERVNIACPRGILTVFLDRLVKVFRPFETKK